MPSDVDWERQERLKWRRANDLVPMALRLHLASRKLPVWVNAVRFETAREKGWGGTGWAQARLLKRLMDVPTAEELADRCSAELRHQPGGAQRSPRPALGSSSPRMSCKVSPISIHPDKQPPKWSQDIRSVSFLWWLMIRASFSLGTRETWEADLPPCCRSFLPGFSPRLEETALGNVSRLVFFSEDLTL